MILKKMVLGCGILVAAAAIAFGPATISAQAAQDAEIDWENTVLVVVDEDSNLSVRSEASTSSKIVGKMYRGAIGEIVEQGEEWTKITSGSVEGYVKNEFCLFGTEAQEAVDEVCGTIATVTGSHVRLRSKPSTSCSVYRTLNSGTTFSVATDEEEVEGWVAVSYLDSVAYICADYVDVELGISEALTLSEVYAQKSSGYVIEASDSDVTLLAALIYCEAGGECYAGKLAVGAVVVNRVNSSSFPNTISGVIYQKSQFTPASSGKLKRVLNSGNIPSSCYEAAKEALSGTDNTGGAKYFHAGRGRGTQIGNQVFY